MRALCGQCLISQLERRVPLSAQIELKLSLFSVNLNRLITVGKHRQDVISDSLLAVFKELGKKKSAPAH